MPRAIRTFVLTFALVGVIAPAGAVERVLSLTPEKTEVSFDLEATGHDVHGVARLTRGEIRFDEQTGAASGEIVIDAASSATGSKSRDETMHDDVLEVVRFPVIRFLPEKLVGTLGETGESKIELRGRIDLHGVEHPLALPATIRRDGDRLTIQSAFAIPYQEWGLEDPSILFLRVAKVVGVKVDAEASLSSLELAAAGN